MISIINGYDFKRNNSNEIVYAASSLATILGLQPYLVKEHYFHCVADACYAEGEFHTEEVINGEVELYLGCFAVKELIDSLKRENFKIDEFQSENVLKYMLETQSVVSDCFVNQNGFTQYLDPIRKINPPFVKDVCESITQRKDD